MGTIEEGARGGREIYEQEAVGRNGWGREGKQEGKRWEGSHEWRQPGEGDRGDKSRESERERDTGGGARAGRVPCTVCHLAISWPTTRSQHEAFYEWAEAIIEALD